MRMPHNMGKICSICPKYVQACACPTIWAKYAPYVRNMCRHAHAPQYGQNMLHMSEICAGMRMPHNMGKICSTWSKYVQACACPTIWAKYAPRGRNMCRHAHAPQYGQNMLHVVEICAGMRMPHNMGKICSTWSKYV